MGWGGAERGGAGWGGAGRGGAGQGRAGRGVYSLANYTAVDKETIWHKYLLSVFFHDLPSSSLT